MAKTAGYTATCTCPQIDVTPSPGPPWVKPEYIPGRPDPRCPQHGRCAAKWGSALAHSCAQPVAHDGDCICSCGSRADDGALPHPPPAPVDALVIRPGDTLIVRVPTNTTMQHATLLKERLAELLPDVQARVIAAEQLAVYRPTASTSTEATPTLPPTTDNQQT